MKYNSFPLIDWYSGKDYSIDLSESGISLKNYDRYSVQIPSKYVKYYGNTAGDHDLIALLSSIYDIDPRQVIITNGATEALFLSLECILEPNDEIIIATPYYNNIGNVLRRKGVNVIECFYDLDIANTEAYIDRLLSLTTSKTKAVLLCTVFNPSGTVISEKDYYRLIDYSVDNGVYLICDDVFAEFSLSEHKYLIDYHSLSYIIHINGMSKVYGAPGLRIGWIISSQNTITNIENVKVYVSENVSRISQWIAYNILTDRNSILQDNDTIISQNIKALKSFCSRHTGLNLKSPSGGCCCLIEYDYKIDSYTLCSDIYEKIGILLAPGDAFGYRMSFRLGFGIDTKSFEKNLLTLENYFIQQEV